MTRTTTTAPGATTTDRRLLALLAAVIASLVTWEVALIVGRAFPLLFWLPTVPHLLIGGIGAFLVLRTDARRLGWLLALSTLFLTQFIGSSEWEATSATWAGVLEGVGGLPLAFLVTAVILYPTGRAESRVLAALVVIEATAITLTCLHWAGVNLGWWEALTDPLQLAVAASSLPMVVSMVEQVRIYRRRPELEQKQVKWYVVGLFAFPMYAVPGLLGWSENAFIVTDLFVTMLFPLAILVGITRYKLYEIDRLVSRTVAYTLVVALLAVLGVGGVTAVTSLLPTQDQLAVALSTIVVVALFDPLRRRVVDVVDRRFDRTRYVARQVVEGFGHEVQDVTDLDEIGNRVHAVIGRTVAPTTVAVWQPRTESPRRHR